MWLISQNPRGGTRKIFGRGARYFLGLKFDKLLIFVCCSKWGLFGGIEQIPKVSIIWGRGQLEIYIIFWVAEKVTTELIPEIDSIGFPLN